MVSLGGGLQLAPGTVLTLEPGGQLVQVGGGTDIGLCGDYQEQQDLVWNVTLYFELSLKERF